MDYKHLKDVYVIYILIEITSLRLSRVFLFFIVIFFICVFILMFSTLPITAFLV